VGKVGDYYGRRASFSEDGLWGGRPWFFFVLRVVGWSASKTTIFLQEAPVSPVPSAATASFFANGWRLALDHECAARNHSREFVSELPTSAEELDHRFSALFPREYSGVLLSTIDAALPLLPEMLNRIIRNYAWSPQTPLSSHPRLALPSLLAATTCPRSPNLRLYPLAALLYPVHSI